ncbi:MAG: tRNA (guanosine(46)-N7)-methyltransferase TrmB [Planctomycetes bacterium]|nr:tRNA (guanosine(46)-N7)-methyltransferase TrmB [Planctomycetota bacterium]
MGRACTNPGDEGVLPDEAIMLDAPRDGEVVDPLAWYDTPGPFELEIGCGKGGFLLARARAHPELRLLGIEWANKFYRYGANRMARWGLTNVRVMRTDARTFVLRSLPPTCLAALHLYHPDPWPKKRHHKRRLVQGDFVAAAVRALVPGARWYVQSDHEEYFAQIRSLLSARAELRELSDAEFDWQGAEWAAGTNYEIKYRRKGRAIFRAAYERAR